ncbi:sugar transferase [Calothrix sp. FACHB-1219]|uniref:sugar transferase n=1 Tax=Calothrix sp. FACHB-168 TaxID=2692780 RepID=UPI0016854956|nr:MULTISPECIES: sugar transferase [unclassified Calothrix]MBD2201598.1 sugar transferase [Calothrix sp. FACHB-168]MBD2217284.1 sugar transferase [Calothrix sp. FACHB-1219]
MSYKQFKRVLDVVGASILLVSLFPLMSLVALLIVLEDGMPFIFSQTRVGYKGNRFVAYKFRSMVRDADKLLVQVDDLSGKYLKTDKRITKIGSFIRRTSIDELPQLINVLRGEMSLVGPRPFAEYDAVNYPEDRLDKVLPGITGSWQVKGRRWVLDKSAIAKIDREYSEGYNFLWDLYIIFRTILYIVTLGNR